jgi:hypothetical protein
MNEFYTSKVRRAIDCQNAKKWYMNYIKNKYTSKKQAYLRIYKRYALYCKHGRKRGRALERQRRGRKKGRSRGRGRRRGRSRSRSRSRNRRLRKDIVRGLKSKRTKRVAKKLGKAILRRVKRAIIREVKRRVKRAIVKKVKSFPWVPILFTIFVIVGGFLYFKFMIPKIMGSMKGEEEEE